MTGRGGTSSMGDQTSIPVTELRGRIEIALRQSGYSPAETAVIADVLMFSQVRGGNQGVAKLLGPGMPRPTTRGEIEVSATSPLSVLVNGNQHHAMVVVTKALELALDRARTHGIGLAGTHSTSTSSGALGFYARAAAEAGFVAIIMASSDGIVAPHGSVDAVFGTNPLAIAVPGDDGPAVLDMTTAAIPYYGVVEAIAAGRKLPDGIAYDADGLPTTDPERARAGALRTFDRGHRGSGLAFMIQVLAGPLVCAATPGDADQGTNWGHLLIALDPAILGGRQRLLDGVGTLTHTVRDARPAHGTPPRVPGERSESIADRVRMSGTVEIDAHILAGLLRLTDDAPDEGRDVACTSP